MKKLLYITPIFALLIALVPFNVAKAVSPYDNVKMSIASKLETQCLNDQSVITDITTDIIGEFMSHEETNPNFQDPPQASSAKLLLQNSFSKGKGWATYKTEFAGQKAGGIIIYNPDQIEPVFEELRDPYSQDPTLKPTFAFKAKNGGTINPDNFKTVTVVDYGQYGKQCGERSYFYGYTPYGMREQSYPDNTHVRTNPPDQTDEPDFQPYLIADDIAYPPDYDGPKPPYTALPATDIRPNIVADVNDKNVSIRSKKNVTLDGTDYKIYWFITNANIDGEGPETPFSLDGYSLPEGVLSFVVPEYGDYQLNANFVATDGSPLQVEQGINLKQTVIKVNINGSTFSVDSDNLECGQGDNDEDFCSTPVNEFTPEQCDWFNPLTWGGCFKNVFHYIGEALGINKTTSNPTGSPFIAFTTDTKGLTAIITAPLNIFNNLSTGYYTCNPLTIPLPHLNRTLQLPCLGIFYTNHLGGYFSIYQTIIGGIVSYYVLVRMLELVKGFKDPQNDKIEVAKL